MKKQKKLFEDMAKQVVKKIVYQEVYEWPPQCAVFYYQPLRPKNASKQKRAAKNER